jgi:hypothetical protein
MENNYLKSFVMEFIRFTLPHGNTYLIINRNSRNTVFSNANQYQYIFVVNVLEDEKDIQSFLDEVYAHLTPHGRCIVIYRNYLHSFVAGFFTALFNRKKTSTNWLSTYDIEMFLHLANFDCITCQSLCFTTKIIPFVTECFNRFILHIFPFNHLSFLHYVIARKVPKVSQNRSVSIVIPARSEEGNIQRIFDSLPIFGSTCEIIFVEGHSKDKTKYEIERCIQIYSKKLPFKFLLINQKEGIGKADAVWRGFNKSTGDILIIFDADMSMAPFDLQKFYTALVTYKGDFINGSRLVYPKQNKAMQFINILGNKFFGIIYCWLLGQRVKDTLCGTKALWREDFNLMKKDKTVWKQFDPFGDFSLLLGASKLNRKIIDIPVRYYERTYGSTNIKRFLNALELARYCLFATKSVKMRLP